MVELEMKAGQMSSSTRPAAPTVAATPGRAPGEESAALRMDEDESHPTSQSGPSPPNQNIMIGGAVGAGVLLMLIIVLLMGGGGGGQEGEGGGTPAPAPSKVEASRIVVSKFCEIPTGAPEVHGASHSKVFMTQLQELCDKKEDFDAAAFEFYDHEQFLLKAKGALKSNLHFAPLTKGQISDWENFRLGVTAERSYVVPLLAYAQSGGKYWGVEPSTFLDTAAKKGNTISITGDRDADNEWFEHYPNPLKMTMEHWEKMTIRLSEDMETVLKYSKAQYSMQVSILDEEDVGKQTSLGKHTWYVKDADNKGMGLLFGGITDYLFGGPDKKNGDAKIALRAQADPDDTLRACKFFLFVTTQMVRPCRCGHDETHGHGRSDDVKPTDECIDHFDSVFKEILGSALPSEDADKLEKVCEAISGDEMMGLMGFEGQFLQHTINTLEADEPCNGGWRRPDHCLDTFTFKGKPTSGCDQVDSLFDDIRAPWCSWEENVDADTADWDGPWSFCVKCTPSSSPTLPTPVPGGLTGDRLVASKFCEDKLWAVETGEEHWEAFMTDFEELCNDGAWNDVEIKDCTDCGDGFVLKAKGALKSDLLFKPLTADQKENWEFWNMGTLGAAGKRRSYVIPLLAMAESSGQVWGVEPSPYIDYSQDGKYSIASSPEPNSDEWTSVYGSNKFKMTMEHWEKMTIRLSEDVSELLKYSSANYKLHVGVLSSEDVGKKNSLGKHTWWAKDKDGNDKGLLFGGITDYEGTTSPSGANDALRACKFFLYVTTQLVTPCRCSHDHSDDGHDHGHSDDVKPSDQCIDHFDTVFKEILGEDLNGDDVDKLDKVCEAIEGRGGTMRFEGELLQHAIETLEGDRPCKGGYRSPEHCKDTFTFNGQKIEGCATSVHLFPDVKAPWCSWEDTVEDTEDFDGPWSFCVKCTNPAPQPTMPPQPITESEQKSAVSKFCGDDNLYTVGSESKHLEVFLTQFKEQCGRTDNFKNDVTIESLDGDQFLLKANGALKSDLIFKPLNTEQKESWVSFWTEKAEKDMQERSYVIPLLAMFESDGQVWGVEPSTFLDMAFKKGKTYDISGDGANDWMASYPSPLKMTMEHWEKMTIRLSEDIDNLLKYSSANYKLKVSVLDTEYVGKKTSLGKHTWWTNGEHGQDVGLLFGGITDYLSSPISEIHGDDPNAACKFFLFVSTQMVTPCKSSHDESTEKKPSDDCVEHFDDVFREILGGELPAEDADKLDKVCDVIEGRSGPMKLMSFEAGLLQHALETLEGDQPCVDGWRQPETCKGSFTFEGKPVVGCATDVFLFEDIHAPWCSWVDPVEGTTDWDGPWSFCVKCSSTPEDRPVDKNEGKLAVESLCSIAEEDDVQGLDASMQETMKQIGQLCEETGGMLETTDIDDDNLRSVKYLVKAKGPLKIDVHLFKLMATERENFGPDGSPTVEPPVKHSLLVPTISSFTVGNGVWAVTPTTMLDNSAASRVGGLKSSYKIGGVSGSAGWYDFSEEYNKGLSISWEHWEKLIVRLAEDAQMLTEMGSISYAGEVSIYKQMPEEDTPVQNALGKHVLRAYDFTSGAEVGLLTGGVVDYLQKGDDLQKEYACEFMLLMTTEMLTPCRWPVASEKPEEQNCLRDFTGVWPKLVKTVPDSSLPKDKFLKEICATIVEETNIFQDVGKILEFADQKLNGELECEEHNGMMFRRPEHCKAEFEYGGEKVSGCSEKELFADIKAPWCSWNDKVDEHVDWDGPWSFCTLCPSGEDALDRRSLVV